MKGKMKFKMLAKPHQTSNIQYPTSSILPFIQHQNLNSHAQALIPVDVEQKTQPLAAHR
jgi:hypothetical protein